MLSGSFLPFRHEEIFDNSLRILEIIPREIFVYIPSVIYLYIVKKLYVKFHDLWTVQ